MPAIQPWAIISLYINYCISVKTLQVDFSKIGVLINQAVRCLINQAAPDFDLTAA